MESTSGDFVLRNFTEEDLPAFERFWVDELGFFRLGVNLIRQWYRADPEGFFGIFLGDQLVASGSATKQTEDLYFIGSIGVTSSQRRKGLCKRMLDRLFERCIGGNYVLYSDPDSVPIYRRLGFKVLEKETAYIYYGKAAALPEQETQTTLQFEVVDSSKLDLIRSLVEYDARVHGFERQIRCTLIEDEDSSVVACLQEGSIVGYARIATLRKHGGAFIGPLYADQPAIAQRLLENVLTNNRSRAEVSVCMFASSRAAFLAQKLKLEREKEASMCCTYPERIPAMRVHEIFAFDSLNFAIC